MRRNRGIIWTRVGRVSLIVHAPRNPTDAEWEELITSTEMAESEAYIVVANGARPSAKQRGQFYQYHGRRKVRTAVLTDSVATRGAVTALSWLGASIRAFSHSESRAAMRYAGVADSDVPEVSRALRILSEQIVQDTAGA